MSSVEPHGCDILLPPDGSISKLQENLKKKKKGKFIKTESLQSIIYSYLLLNSVKTDLLLKCSYCF